MFKYEAYDSKRRKEVGILIAEDTADALLKLREWGLVPIHLTNMETKTSPSISIWEKDFHFTSIYKIKVKKNKLAVLLKQLAIMLTAGVSLIYSIRIIIDEEKDKTVKMIFTEIERDLQAGIPLSEAMKKFAAFSEVIINVIASGELNGHLDDSLERVSVMIEKEAAMANKVKGAMVYPAFLLALTVVVVIILNTVVLPTFIKMYEQFDAELPLITRFVMGLSNVLLHDWPLLVGCVAVLLLLYQFVLKKSVAFCMTRDSLFLKIPIVGTLLRKSYIARFTRVMASLVLAGVDIISALESAQKVIQSDYVRFLITRTIGYVKLGMPISEAMKKYPFFDPLLVSIIRVGEETGMFSESLQNVATLYESQTEEAAKSFTSVIEPFMTVLMALVIGTVIVSVVMPLFSMYSIMGG